MDGALATAADDAETALDTNIREGGSGFALDPGPAGASAQLPKRTARATEPRLLRIPQAREHWCGAEITSEIDVAVSGRYDSERSFCARSSEHSYCLQITSNGEPGNENIYRRLVGR